MDLYLPKEIRTGFLVLCPAAEVGHAKTTVNSIRYNYPDAPYLLATPAGSHPADRQDMQALGRVVTGGDTRLALINAGLAQGPGPEWNMVVFAGSWVRQFLDKKMSYFIESESDVLFPVANRKLHFVEGTLNGLLVHRRVFAQVGPFSTKLTEENAKAAWAADAIRHGARFKAVVGAALK